MSAVVIPLAHISTILPSNAQSLRSDSSHDPSEGQHKARVYPPLRYASSENSSVPSAADTSCSAVGLRPFVTPERSWYTPFVLGVGGRKNSVVTADLLGSSVRVKPLVAEGKGVRAVRCFFNGSYQYHST